MKKKPQKTVSFLHIFFASLKATEWPSLSITRRVFLATLKPELVSFSHCQSASKVYWAVFLRRDFPPRPAFLCVLHCSSTHSLQLLPHLLCKSRTPHPREWGICPPTGSGDSLWELQGKERAAFCFYFLPSGTGATGPALLVLFHHGQIQYHVHMVL